MEMKMKMRVIKERKIYRRVGREAIRTRQKEREEPGTCFTWT